MRSKLSRKPRLFSSSSPVFTRRHSIKSLGRLFNRTFKDLIQFQSWLDQFWFGALGYGAKKGFVHLDQRNGKGWRTGGQKCVRWNY